MATQLALVPKTIEQLTQAITVEWQRAEKSAATVIAAFIHIGRYIRQAEKQLGEGTVEYQRFLTELPFSQSHAVKFKKLADHPVLTKKSNLDKLPPSIYSLYQLSLLDPKDLQANLDAGVITAQSTRREIAQVKRRDDYQPFCTILISSSLTGKDRASLIASVSQTFTKNPALTFKLSKAIKKEGLARLREQAEAEYDKLVEKVDPKNRLLSSLVDHAIEAIRKSATKTLPKDFGRRDQLKRDLGIKITQEVRQAEIYQAARQHKVVCRFLPLSQHDPYLKLWASVMEWCDTGNPKKLERFANEKIQGKTSAKTAKKKDAVSQARQILDEYRMFLNA